MEFAKFTGAYLPPLHIAAISAARTSRPFPAPACAPWSLIGQMGAGGTSFEVGSAWSSVASDSAELYLGVNDNYLGDNSGAWKVYVTLR